MVHVDLVKRAAGYEAFDVIAGGETAGIPFAAWMAEHVLREVPAR